MFTQKITDSYGGIWLCGASACTQNSFYLDGEKISAMFYAQDNGFADLMLYEEGEYTFLPEFSRHTGHRLYIGYWYMENGSFEPKCKIIDCLSNDSPLKITYRKTKPDVYYGGLALITEPPADKGTVADIFEGGGMEISFCGFPKNVCDPIIIIHNDKKAVSRIRIGGVTLRSATQADGSTVCDVLELTSGKITRYISPEQDNCINGNLSDKYVLPLPAQEKAEFSALSFPAGCTVCSNSQIKLYPI